MRNIAKVRSRWVIANLKLEEIKQGLEPGAEFDTTREFTRPQVPEAEVEAVSSINLEDPA
jgi:hypothetical protein